LHLTVKKRGKKTGSIKICCGYAGLTQALAEAGFNVIGVDWHGNRHEPKVPIVTADLTTEDGQEFVRNPVRQDHVMYVHLAPPRGTYTRARESRSPVEI
jgi:nucleoside-diphosphate-sugar epimerase